MRRNFDADFAKCINPVVYNIDDFDYRDILRFIDLFVTEKCKEKVYQDDGLALRKRCFTKVFARVLLSLAMRGELQPLR